MKKLILLLLLIFGFCSNAFATKFMYNFGSNTNNSADVSYWYIDGIGTSSAFEAQRFMPVALPVKLSNLSVVTTIAPTAGQGVIYTVFVNGVATALTCTIPDLLLVCTDTTHTLYLNKNDNVSIYVTKSGTPTYGPFVGYVQAEIENNNYDSLVGSGANNTSVSNAVTNYLGLFTETPSTSEAAHQFVIPLDGYLSKLYVQLSGIPGAGKSYTITVRKNGADTALTIPVADSATTNEDLFNRIAVSAGDLIAVSVVPSGTPTARIVSFSAVYTSSISGYFIKGMNTGSTSLSPSSTYYTAFVGTIAPTTSGLTQNELIPPNLYLKRMYAYLATAPDTGVGTQSYAITLRDSTASSNTTATCTISDIAQSCLFKYPVPLPATDMRASYSAVPSGTPAASTLTVGGAFTLIPPQASNIKGY